MSPLNAQFYVLPGSEDRCYVPRAAKVTLCIGGELNTASKTSFHLAWVTERLQGNLSSSVSARGQGHAGPTGPTGTSPRGRPCGLRALRAGLCCLVSGFLSFSDLWPSPSFPIPMLCVKLVVVPSARILVLGDT